ncbi:GEVED domain-containing protein [Nocardioides sp. TF02-7]|uniref:GEVED domain-containing protein n=1 Tax=Nocardioides sp. TF02-7 TaxID=2917724 RepID=UPI001F0657EF|nr:GEVED domain-containing protein [Nocardioides sp. TF02-7]UMG93886.1 GEVED domain-containing protein [Nocardioides sp. TF02-7]
MNASDDGFASVWVDWNLDGDFADDGEQVAAAQPVTAGDNDVTFSRAVNPDDIRTHVRVRVSSDATAVASPTGPAPDGEVEDYRVLLERLISPAACSPTTQPYYAMTFGDVVDQAGGGAPGHHRPLHRRLRGRGPGRRHDRDHGRRHHQRRRLLRERRRRDLEPQRLRLPRRGDVPLGAGRHRHPGAVQQHLDDQRHGQRRAGGLPPADHARGVRRDARQPGGGHRGPGQRPGDLPRDRLRQR